MWSVNRLFIGVKRYYKGVNRLFLTWLEFGCVAVVDPMLYVVRRLGGSVPYPDEAIIFDCAFTSFGVDPGKTQTPTEH